MKYLSFILTLALALSSFAGEKLQLSLEKAKEIALAQNPTLAQAQANIAAAAAALESARAAYYPSLDLSAGITRLRDNATRPARDFSNTTRYDVGLSAAWLIFNGGKRHFNNLIAELGGETALMACEDAKRTLLENVAYAFFVVMQSQDSMEIAEQDADYNRQLHDDAKKKYDYGKAMTSEVLNFEYQVAAAEADYISSERIWRNACVVLGQLLAIPQESIWDNIELVPPEEAALHTDTPSVSELLDYAMAHRPDLLAAQNAVEAAELQVKIAQAAWYPTISAFGSYGYERTHSAHFNKHYDRSINFGVSASWNIFSGFATQAGIDEANAALEYRRKALEQLRLAVDAEIRSNYNALESSRKNLEQQNQLLDIVTRIRDLVREEYLGGTATITRLNEVQTDLTNTKSARSIAYITVLVDIEHLAASTAWNIRTPEQRTSQTPAN